MRESSFWNGVLPKEESEMITRHIINHGIDLRLETELSEIIPDENGRATAVITNKGETISCQLVGLTVGVSPNIDFLKDSGIELGRGVKVNRYLETNIKDVFAIGDCAEQNEGIGLRSPIEAVWYTGRMMGEILNNIIQDIGLILPSFLILNIKRMVGCFQNLWIMNNNFTGNMHLVKLV